MTTNPKKITTRKHFMEIDNIDDIDGKIEHLMLTYHWKWQEAMEHLYYHEYDPVDWIDSPWEEPCSLPPY